MIVPANNVSGLPSHAKGVTVVHLSVHRPSHAEGATIIPAKRSFLFPRFFFCFNPHSEFRIPQ
jgi:hypothetical protein